MKISGPFVKGMQRLHVPSHTLLLNRCLTCATVRIHLTILCSVGVLHVSGWPSTSHSSAPQVFHMCQGGRRSTFHCPGGTLFSQRLMTCVHDYAYEREECAAAPQLYTQNQIHYTQVREGHQREIRNIS